MPVLPRFVSLLGSLRSRPATVSMIISYGSNDYRFVGEGIAQALRLSEEVVVTVCDHFFDGIPEIRPLLEQTRRENPRARFVQFPFEPGRAASIRGWHNLSRLIPRDRFRPRLSVPHRRTLHPGGTRMPAGPLVTLYRISDRSYKKVKLAHATKLHCLENFLSVFGREGLVLFADNCTPETVAAIRTLGLDPRESASATPARSWRMVAEYALDSLPEAQCVYFVEDDYLHLPDAKAILLEGLAIADYVTLYDHLDKYVNGKDGGNPQVKQGGEFTRVLLTRSTHWKWTNSTTMTVATRVRTLREDKAVWWWYSRGRHPKDYDIFCRLRRRFLGRRRVLISPIPGRATHVEHPWFTPLVDWTRV